MTYASEMRLVVVLLVLGVLSAAFTLAERLRPEVRGQRRKPGSLRTDLIYLVLMPFVTRLAALIGIVSLLAVIAIALGTPLERGALRTLLERPTSIRQLPIALQALLALLLADFVGYWMHRAFHRAPLWRVHAIHHSTEQLDWLAAARVHPLNAVLARMAQVAVLVPLGFDPRVLAGAAPVFAIYGLLLHANVSWSFGALRYVLASPAFHRWHHAADAEGLDKNFAGLFPFWDLVFGTFHLPAGGRARRYGLVGESVPDGVLGQLAYPFRLPRRR